MVKWRKGVWLVVLILIVQMSIPVSRTLTINQIGNEYIEKSNLGNTLYVGGSGPNNYSKIQDAIDDAFDGDTIFVYSGTYYEYELTIDKSISFIGEDKFTTIIDGQGKNRIMKFKANYISVRGFTIQNTEEGPGACGIYISNSGGSWTAFNTITDNIFINHSMEAIYMYTTSHNTITNNTLIDCGWRYNSHLGITCGSYNRDNIIFNNTLVGSNIRVWGVPEYNIIANNHVVDGRIVLSRGHHNIIRNNLIENGKDIALLWDTSSNIVEHNLLISSGSIKLSESLQNIVRNNTFIDSNGITINGDNVDYWNSHAIENNNIDGKPIYYINNEYGVTVPSDAGQIILANSINCVIQNLTFSKVWGIQVGFSSENVIDDNNVTEAIESGILLHSSSNNDVTNNNLKSNTWDGIELKGTSVENLISNNIVEKNEVNGIQITEDSSGNSITGNIVRDNNEDGIRISSEFNSIFNNVIDNNNETGLYCSGSNNQIYQNNVINNGIGIYLSFTVSNEISENNIVSNRYRNVYFSAGYRYGLSNNWDENYYGDVIIQGVKIILGRIQTRFGYYSGGDRPYWIWIYRLGLAFDWHPAQDPYDIGG